MKPVTCWDSVPLVLDLPLAGRIVGQSPEYLKKRAQRGEFPAYKEGSQWRVSKERLRRYISEREVG